MSGRVRVAAAHLAPVLLDKAATLARALDAIDEAARGGAQLVAFPESYLPGFPIWSAVAPPIRNHALFAAMAAASIAIDGAEIMALRLAAKKRQMFISFGFSELSAASVGCIWNANILIGDDGAILNHHRKLVPTFFEKMIWSNGDGHGLRVCNTRIGRIGALICGENTNPLARFALIAQGEELHISTYPPQWPTHELSAGRNYDLERAIMIRAGAHAFEAKAFNLVVSAAYDAACRDVLAQSLSDEELAVIENAARGVSMVVGPSGEPVSDVLRGGPGIIYCDIDLSECVEPKQFHDLAGYYNRFDVFDLRVNRRRLAPARFDDPDPGVAAMIGDDGWEQTGAEDGPESRATRWSRATAARAVSGSS